MKRTVLMAGCAIFAMAALTGAASGDGPGRWSVSAGPAWRSSVKSSIEGRVGGASSVPASHKVSYDKDVAGHGPWSVDDVVVVRDPNFPAGPEFLMYAATQTKTETTVTPGYGTAELGGSDRDSPLGVCVSAGYDMYTGRRFSAGLSLRFAGYWGMESQAYGLVGGGTVRSQSQRDYYLFSDGPIPGDTDFSYFYPDAEPYAPYRQNLGTTGSRVIPGDPIGAKISSDLYQVGIGPRVTWRVADWLDVFGSAEALCNFARLDFECGGARKSDTESLAGAAARLGMAAYLTKNIGLQAEAGYEWVDEAEISMGNIRAKADYSSFVASAGIAVRF